MKQDTRFKMPGDCTVCKGRGEKKELVKTKWRGLYYIFQKYYCPQCNCNFSEAVNTCEKPSKFEKEQSIKK